MAEPKPFKRRDVKPCCMCGKGVGAAGLDFYRLRGLDHMVLDPSGIQRTHGLEQFFGGGVAGAMLANAMGDDPDLAQTMTALDEALVCSECGMQYPLAAIAEAIADREQVEAADAIPVLGDRITRRAHWHCQFCKATIVKAKEVNWQPTAETIIRPEDWLHPDGTPVLANETVVCPECDRSQSVIDVNVMSQIKMHTEKPDGEW